MSRCLECGRILKTGRKYCFEHRGIGKTGESGQMRKLKRAYFKRRAIYTTIPIFIMFIALFYIILSYWDANRDKLGDSFALLFFLIAMGLVPVIFLIIQYSIKMEIKRRSDRFINFAKDYAAGLKNEKEFRKSIFHQ